MSYETILVETKGNVGIITLNRPKALNALNSQLFKEMNGVLEGWETDQNIRCVLITGSDKAFAAGADIKEMEPLQFPGTYVDDFITPWDRMSRFRKPLVAAVAGYALGGGCEVAMMCDIVLAADNAQFGQPEIKLGVIPGAGGTQRLTRIIGKAKAMELVLTGRMMGAEEAERAGLVARIVPLADLKTEALKVAESIAALSLPAVMAAKECVQRAYETTLAEGIRGERRMFQSLFGTHDQKEGMNAFVSKRPPSFKHR
jgi:enoyl-CoA hydratase